MKCLKCGAAAPPNLTSSLCPTCLKTKSDHSTAGSLAILAIVLVAGFATIRGCSGKEQSVAKSSEAIQSLPVAAYEPSKILEEAEREFSVKDYDATVKTLTKLKGPDLDEPRASSLYSRASSLAAKEAAGEARGKRLRFATEYERGLLQAGMDATVRAEGKNADTLTITFVLVNRPLVYNMINDSATMSEWSSLGFKKVRFSDGYESSWSQSLQ